MHASKLRMRGNTSPAPLLDLVHATGTMSLMADLTADPADDYWTIDNVAAYWHVAPQTIRTYRSRRRGELPEPDRMFGRSPVWRPSTIIEFQRPGRGARTDLKPASAPSGSEQGQPADPQEQAASEASTSLSTPADD